MYLTIKPFLVLLSLGLAFGFFLLSAKKLWQLMFAVNGVAPKIDNFPARVKAVLVDVLGQGRVRQKKAPGLAHTMIFWGFLVITIGTVEMIIDGIFHGWNLMALGPQVFGAYQAIADIMTLAVLLGVLFGFFRRLILKPKY